MDKGASVPDQALAVPVEPVARLDPSGFDPSRIDALVERAAAVIAESEQDAADAEARGKWRAAASFRWHANSVRQWLAERRREAGA